MKNGGGGAKFSTIFTFSVANVDVCCWGRYARMASICLFLRKQVVKIAEPCFYCVL